jgi:trigger factor
MNVQVEDAGPCRKMLRISAGPEETHAAYADVLRTVSSESRVPGFRRGRAPVAIVESRYAGTVAETVKDRLLPRLYREAVKQQGLSPVAIVEVREAVFRKEKGMELAVLVDVPPDFKLPKYRNIPLTAQPVDVTDEQVDGTLTRIREQAARFDEVTGRPVADGDLVQLDYAATCDGRPLSEASAECAELGAGKDFWVLCGTPEFVPGFNAGLVGAAVGDSRSIPVEFPSDYRVKAAAGRTATYAVTVKALRERKLPVLDEAFLKPFGVASEAELRTRVRDDLRKSLEAREKERQKEEIANFLLARTQMDVPRSVVEEETNMTIRNIVERSLTQGATREQLVGQRDQIMQAATTSSENRIKLSYVLSRIADEEKIEVDESEVDQRIVEMAGRYRMTPEKLRAEIDKRNSLERLRSDIRSDKTMDVLLGAAKLN